MSNQPISKEEALQLITAVVDREVSPARRKAFLACIKRYPNIRRQYESAQKIKELMVSRCPKQKAPASLHHWVRKLISSFSSEEFGQDRLN